MEIGNKQNYKIGTNLDEFMEWAINSQADLYFHNLRFDGSFIVNWLYRNGYTYNKTGKKNTFYTVISRMGQWYMIDICQGYKGKRKIHTVIYDSLKKLPFKVEEIAKSYKLNVLKGEIDYTAYRPPNHKLTDEEIAYIKNDLEIVADALQIQFNQGLEKMTIGLDAISDFKAIINRKKFENLFPTVSIQMNENFRLAYRGGFTWVNPKFQNKELEEGIVFDINSMYPSQMYYKPLPYGLPIYFKGEYQEDPEYPLYIAHIRCDFEIKKDKIPTIQIKKNVFKENEYLTSSRGEYPDLYVTNVDWKLIQEHYDLYDVQFLEGWKFRAKTGFFKQYIEKWMYVKTHNEGAIKQNAKLMLNNLYGKFATNPDVTNKIPYLKDDGSLGFTMPKDENGEEIKEFKDPVYTPLAVFITSWARDEIIRTAQKVYHRIIYCDTDSMHLLGTEPPKEIADKIDDNKLGFWKHESTFKRAKFIRQKTYIEEIYAKWVEKDGERIKKPCGKDEAETTILSVKCAGMPESVKKHVTFENFKIGFSYGYDPITGNGNPDEEKDAKLLPKQVPGGVVLMPTIFTIKG